MIRRQRKTKGPPPKRRRSSTYVTTSGQPVDHDRDDGEEDGEEDDDPLADFDEGVHALSSDNEDDEEDGAGIEAEDGEDSDRPRARVNNTFLRSTIRGVSSFNERLNRQVNDTAVTNVNPCPTLLNPPSSTMPSSTVPTSSPALASTETARPPRIITLGRKKQVPPSSANNTANINKINTNSENKSNINDTNNTTTNIRSDGHGTSQVPQAPLSPTSSTSSPTIPTILISSSASLAQIFSQPSSYAPPPNPTRSGKKSHGSGRRAGALLESLKPKTVRLLPPSVLNRGDVRVWLGDLCGDDLDYDGESSPDYGNDYESDEAEGMLFNELGNVLTEREVEWLVRRQSVVEIMRACKASGLTCQIRWSNWQCPFPDWEEHFTNADTTQSRIIASGPNASTFSASVSGHTSLPSAPTTTVTPPTTAATTASLSTTSATPAFSAPTLSTSDSPSPSSAGTQTAGSPGRVGGRGTRTITVSERLPSTTASTASAVSNAPPLPTAPAASDAPTNPPATTSTGDAVTSTDNPPTARTGDGSGTTTSARPRSRARGGLFGRALHSITR